MTQSLVEPDTADTTDSGDLEVFHYVKRDRIAQSAVEGTHVVALCGETFPVTKSPKPNSPVCVDCKRVYDRIKK